MLNALLITLLASFPLVVASQTKLDSVKQFIEDSDSIFIAKAIEVGPVNIIAQSRVKLEILHVVKGDATLKQVTPTIRHRMKAGNSYLVRLAKALKGGESREVVIEFHETDNPELVKTLSPRIIVLRTINIQLGRLESTINLAQSETDLLKNIKTTN